MDLDLKIIEGVQEFPALHYNGGNLDERNHAWMQLAEKLDMHVQILRIRWHALLQLYQKDSNFKYSNKMQFIYRNAERQVKADNWPEFVITDEFLKGYNNEDQEQFIYLEAEEENNSQSIKSSKENDCNYNKLAEDKYLNNKEDDSSATGKKSEDVNRIVENHTQDNVIVINSHFKSDENDAISNTIAVREKEFMAADHLNKNENNTSVEQANEKSSEKLSPVVGERCEDVIFGELVSAMLKRMDENKKKSIKKEIMNILFS